MDISVVLQIAKVFPVTKSILQLNRLAVQQQIGIHDCGVFSVAFAFEVCAGNDVEKMHFEQFLLRKHLCVVKER